MRRAHGLLEHCDQRALDIRRRVCGVEKIRRRAVLKSRGNVCNIIVGIAVFVVGKVRICVLDGLIGNVEDGDRYPAIFHRRAIVGRRDAVWRNNGRGVLQEDELFTVA